MSHVSTAKTGAAGGEFMRRKDHFTLKISGKASWRRQYLSLKDFNKKEVRASRTAQAVEQMEQKTKI